MLHHLGASQAENSIQFGFQIACPASKLEIENGFFRALFSVSGLISLKLKQIANDDEATSADILSILLPLMLIAHQYTWQKLTFRL